MIAYFIGVMRYIPITCKLELHDYFLVTERTRTALK